ncbi:hypothetical protein ACFLX6_02210 [Chloroflexota bacterium]
MYEVVWPSGKKTVESASFAKRLDTLEGKTICELWGYLFGGDEIFPSMEKALTKRYSGIKFIGYKQFDSVGEQIEGKPVAVLADKLKQNKCDAVITGVGC